MPRIEWGPEHEAQFRETARNIRERSDHGLSDQRPAFDPKQAAEFKEDCLQGRRAAQYETALVNHGFRYHPDHRLVEHGMNPTGEGLWRHPNKLYQLAFKPTDLPANFPDGPEQFDRWVRAHKRGKEMAAEAADRRILVR